VPIITSPVGVLLVAVAVVAALAIWLLRGRRYRGPRLYGADAEIDREELEAAEREVRDLEVNQRPEEGYEGDDWGPGAARPRPPVQL